MSEQTCPQCGTTTSDFRAIDPGMRLALRQSKQHVPDADQVCANCHDALASKVSAGVQLRTQRLQREKNKVVLWKSRTNLIKQARTLMEAKAYSQAAVAYEKYIKILEIVYNLKPGDLKPDVFNFSARSKELTIVTSVYWDLVRIYDSSPRYGDRMQKSANKLAVFAPHSTIYPDIVRKAELFSRSAKNPAVIRDLLKKLKGKRAGCFIATSAFNDADDITVVRLKLYRDQYLRKTTYGRKGIYLYYKISPSIAHFLDHFPFLKAPVRHILQVFAQHLFR